MSSRDPPLFNKSDFYGLAIVASFFGCLIPVSLAYALFSTKRMRRLPIFWMQGLALAMAFLYTFLELAYLRNSFRIPRGRAPYGNPWYEEGQAAACFRLLVPLVSDIAIVMKVSAFYPSHVGRHGKRLLIIGFPSLLLVARLVTQVLTWVAYSKPTVPYLTQALTAEITMQVVGNCFCSILLLRKTFDLARNKHLTTRRAQRRLAHLIEALLMTFLPAIIVQVSLMIVQFIDIANTNNGNFNQPTISSFQAAIYRAETYCQQVNVIVSVLFGLLATLWSSIRTRSEDLSGLGSESRKSGGGGGGGAGTGGTNDGMGTPGGSGAGPKSGVGQSPVTATFGGSSRPSARTTTTSARGGLLGTAEEDRPLLSFLMDAHAPIDVGANVAYTSALDDGVGAGAGAGPSGTSHGHGHGHAGGAGLSQRQQLNQRTMSTASERSWVRMQSSPGMVPQKGDVMTSADIELESTTGGESIREEGVRTSGGGKPGLYDF
ncbi:hypothetical protein OC842_007549 [Tilletia horrida]|uniref:Uncharacterized protein n=1 Tax=Tilletia horrida TaxID=155126 RepID=A0AAN6G3N0_9BASI|nr:hypothetical protein OC842_007549 [Tilletia horrida]